VNLSKLLSTKPNKEAGNNRVFAAPDRERAANDPLQVIVGSAAMVIAWAELF
jgi:hypothetical protein